MPKDINDPFHRKAIKDFEFALQIEGAGERKVEYDPIDAAVSAYSEVRIESDYSLETYAQAMKVKPKEVEDQIGTVELMMDYWRFMADGLPEVIENERDSASFN